jgi:hypothetical protein
MTDGQVGRFSDVLKSVVKGMGRWSMVESTILERCCARLKDLVDCQSPIESDKWSRFLLILRLTTRT